MRESALARAWSQPRTRLGIVVLGVIAFGSVVGALFVSDPSATVEMPHSPPSLAHWLGTTGQGQDVLAQLVTATRASLGLGLVIGVAITLLGGLVGITAGYLQGRVDAGLSLLINIMLVMPSLPLAIVVAAYLPSGMAAIAVVLVLTGWAWNARVARSQSLVLRERDFVLAAQLSGESSLQIIMRDIVPNMSALLAAQLIGAVMFAIAAQVGLEFLGLGDSSQPTWGTMLYWAANDQALLTGAWWTFVPVGLVMAFVGSALTLIGFAIDEIANPSLALDCPFRRALGARVIREPGMTPVVRPQP